MLALLGPSIVEGYGGRLAAEKCPTVSEVLSSEEELRWSIWNDTACSRCQLPRPCGTDYPCCVIRRGEADRRKTAYTRMTCNRHINSKMVIPKDGPVRDRMLRFCRDYLRLPLSMPDCEGRPERVPRILHSVSAGTPDFTQRGVSLSNPSFRFHHLNDSEAHEYIRKRLGRRPANAYRCLSAPAWRADLFRFCALSAEGGVYLDADIVPLHPLPTLYSPCSGFTLGHDQPQGFDPARMGTPVPGMQMKMLASVPGSPIAKCMIDHIVANVRRRSVDHSKITAGALLLSGPGLLHRCYEENRHDVAITYIDTRDAMWPMTGLRRGTTILAYEKPNPRLHMKGPLAARDAQDYTELFESDNVFTKQCAL